MEFIGGRIDGHVSDLVELDAAFPGVAVGHYYNTDGITCCLACNLSLWRFVFTAQDLEHLPPGVQVYWLKDKIGERAVYTLGRPRDKKSPGIAGQ
jgi:hypothetical protein